jgi:hypothetical protein
VIGLNPWRAQKASKTLAESVKMLDKVIHQVSEGKSVADFSHAIWEIYSKLEYSILMLKLYLEIENPGKLAGKIKIEEKELDMLAKASDELTAALKSSELEDYPKALESARRARNILRATLLTIRKIRSLNAKL